MIEECGTEAPTELQKLIADVPKKLCYQCMQPVNYLFNDGRGKCCTRLTPEEVQ